MCLSFVCGRGRKEDEISWLNWLKGKPCSPPTEAAKVAPPKAEKTEPQIKKYDDPQENLWHAESSSAMRSLITNMTEKDLTDLVGAIAFADFPLNALASAGGSLDKRSTLTAHFTLQLLKAGKHSQANQLLNKILDKIRAKLSTGARKGGVVPRGQEQAFESAFATGDMGSAIEILKQNRSIDFWHIDEMLKRELYDLSMEMLKKDKPERAAILLDAIMLDYPDDLETEFWRVAAYNNIYNNNKSDAQTKEKAKQAINSFLQKADGNPRFMSQCSDLRRLMSTNY